MSNSNFSRLTSSPRLFSGQRLQSIVVRNFGLFQKRILLSKLDKVGEYVLQPFEGRKSDDPMMEFRTLVFDMVNHKFLGILDLTKDQWNRGTLFIGSPLGNVA